MSEKKVERKPVRDVTRWRKVLSCVPGFCSYCGLKYVSCHSHKIDLMFPVPQNGKCCPNGHEGYTDQMIITGDRFRYWFDAVSEEK